MHKKFRSLVEQGPELKGDVHPIHCPVNALGEVNEEYTYGKASRTADVTDGKIKKTIFATFRWAWVYINFYSKPSDQFNELFSLINNLVL